MIVAEVATLKRETEVFFKNLEAWAFTRKNYGDKKLHGIEIKVSNLGYIVVDEDEDVKQLHETLVEIHLRKINRLIKLQEKFDAIDTLLTDS